MMSSDRPVEKTSLSEALPSSDESKPICPQVVSPSSYEIPTASELAPRSKDWGWTDVAELLSDVATTGGLGAAIDITFGLGKHSTEERLKVRQFQWLLEQIPLMQKKLDKLMTQLPGEEQPEPADVASVMKAAMEVSQKTADAKKRRLLKNALVNAFDVEQYQAGLTLRFFTILEDIEYGDVELLRRLAIRKDAIKIESLEEDSGVQVFGALQFHHLRILETLGLVIIWDHRNHPLGASTNAHTLVSDLGFKFLDFIAETDVTSTGTDEKSIP